MNRDIYQAVQKLRNYIEVHDYRGYDPYDALKSPLFQWPFFRSSKWIRFSVQQLLKRSPLNLRPFFRVPPGYNPVTLGLCIQGYTYLAKADPENTDRYKEKINCLLDELIRLIPEGYSGACWGYDFPWDARYFNIPAYQPTVVATGIISNALFECYRYLKWQQAAELCVSAAGFVLKDLQRTPEGNTFCFSYSPFDQQMVYNASMKGVRCLAQAYALTGDQCFRGEAEKAALFVTRHQQKDGSWPYAYRRTGQWIDNYHTGYVLDCLDEFIRHCQPSAGIFRKALDRGIRFYKTHFFENKQVPRFYHCKTYPIDCTAAAQSILSLTRFNEKEMAENVACWIIEHMQAKEGYFHFRKFKNYQIKTPYMRWSNAWMFAGLSNVLFK